MAGIGAGFGASQVTQNYNAGASNTRAQQQHDFKTRQTDIKEAEQAKLQRNEAGQASTEEKLNALTARVDAEEKKAIGEKTKSILAKGLTDRGDDGARNSVDAMNASPEVKASVGNENGTASEFQANNPRHQEAFTKFLSKAGYDTSDWEQEYKDKVYNKTANSGGGYMNANEYVDGFKLAHVTAALAGESKEDRDYVETKQAELSAMLDGEEAWESWLKDNQDMAGVTEEDKTKMSNATEEDKMARVNKMVADLESEGYGVTTPSSGAGIPEEQGILDVIMPDDTITAGTPRVVTSQRGNVKVTTNSDGSGEAITADGTNVSKSADGSMAATEANGRSSRMAADGSVTTVASDGTVSTGSYILPPSVQMAYDMLGVESSFSEKNVKALNATKAPTTQSDFKFFAKQYKAENPSASMAKIKESWDNKDHKQQTPQQAATSVAMHGYEAGDMTLPELNKELTRIENMKEVEPTKDTEWSNFYEVWQAEPSNASRSVADARQDYKAHKPTDQVDTVEDGDDTDTRAKFARSEVAKMKQGVGEPNSKFTARKDERYRTLMTNIKQEPTQAKQPDKLVMDDAYKARRKVSLAKVNKARLSAGVGTYKPVLKWADLTQAEWDSLDEQEYNDLKMAYANTRANMSEAEKKQLKNMSLTMQSLATIADNYTEGASGMWENMTNNIAQFTGVDSLAGISTAQKARLDSAVASLVIEQASDIAGRPSKDIVNRIEGEIGSLNKADEAVLAKFENAIDKTISILEAQKRAVGDGYYLHYKGDPLNRVKTIKRNLQIANGTYKGGVSDSSVQMNPAERAVSNSLFPTRK